MLSVTSLNPNEGKELLSQETATQYTNRKVRDAALLINGKGTLARGHAIEDTRSELTSLASQIGVDYSTASDLVHSELEALRDELIDQLAQAKHRLDNYKRHFPYPTKARVAAKAS